MDILFLRNEFPWLQSQMDCVWNGVGGMQGGKGSLLRGGRGQESMFDGRLSHSEDCRGCLISRAGQKAAGGVTCWPCSLCMACICLTHPVALAFVFHCD